MIGFIKLNRSVCLEAFYSKGHSYIALALHCYLKANFKKGFFEGHTLKPGQFAAGIGKLGEEVGLTYAQTRVRLNFLEKSGFLTIKTTNKFSIITIVKWEIEQAQLARISKLNNNQSTINQRQYNNEKKEMGNYEHADPTNDPVLDDIYNYEK